MHGKSRSEAHPKKPETSAPRKADRSGKTWKQTHHSQDDRNDDGDVRDDDARDARDDDVRDARDDVRDARDARDARAHEMAQNHRRMA